MARALRWAAVVFFVWCFGCEPSTERARSGPRLGTGGALSESCGGLVPQAPLAAFTRPQRPPATSAISLNGEPNCADNFTADGDGNVAVAVRAEAGLGAVVLDSDGVRVGEGGRFGRDLRGPWPELEGYDVDDTSPNGALLARHFHKSGARPAAVVVPGVLGFAAARDYQGGQLLVYGLACGGGVCAPGGWSLLAQRISGQGVALGTPGLVAVGSGAFPRPSRDGDPRLFAAMSLGGSGLVFWRAEGAAPGSGRLLARWLDADGAPLTPAFEAAKSWPASGTVAALPLIGGGVAVQLDGKWLLRVAEGEPRASEPPAFLKERPNTTVELVRRHLAYASIARKPDGLCRARVEVLAPAGNPCGEALYPLGEPGRACRASPLSIGWDGTVVARTASCAYRWWPHSLE